MSLFSNSFAPHVLSFLHDTDLPPLRLVSHFWHQSVVESLSFHPITWSISNGVKSPCKRHWHRPQKILIVGDGNFSFTLSLCRLLPPIHTCRLCNISRQSRVIYTSTLAPGLQSLEKTHPSSAQHIRIIGKHFPHCTVLFGVDATDLQHTLHISNQLKFDEIIWNFPHSNNHRKIQTNRVLLRKFFATSAEYLAPNGIITVRLCFGQSGCTEMEQKTVQRVISSANDHDGGIPLSLKMTMDREYKDKQGIKLIYECLSQDGDDHHHPRVIKKSKFVKCRAHSNSWKIVEQASHSDFILCDIGPFFWNVFAACGYAQTGRKGNDKQFVIDLSLTLRFIHEQHSLPSAVVRKLYPTAHFRDISFWLSKAWEEYMQKHTFEQFVYDTVGKSVVLKVEFLNEFCHQQTNKKSKEFRIWYLEPRKAFNRYKCSALQSKLRDALRDKLNVGVANNLH